MKTAMESNRKVLVVDDDTLSLEYLKYVLSKKYDVYTAEGVKSFYDIINQIKVDLIIMDVSLKDTKTGFQLTQELKTDERFKEVPVFILTAFSSQKEQQNAFDAGADQFLTKPTNARQLISLIEKELHKTRLDFGSFS